MPFHITQLQQMYGCLYHPFTGICTSRKRRWSRQSTLHQNLDTIELYIHMQFMNFDSYIHCRSKTVNFMVYVWNLAQYKTRSLLAYSLLKQENGQNANYIVCAYNVTGKIFKIVEYDILLVAGCIRAEYTSPLTSSPSSLRWYRCSLPLSAERVRLHYLYTDVVLHCYIQSAPVYYA